MTLTIHDTTMTSDQTDCTARHAANIRANEARASQRRVIVLIRYHPHRKCVVQPDMKTTLAGASMKRLHHWQPVP